MKDVIEVYKRIQKNSKSGRGVQLSWEEACAIMCDGAVQQAIDTAEDEEREERATRREQ